MNYKQDKRILAFFLFITSSILILYAVYASIYLYIKSTTPCKDSDKSALAKPDKSERIRYLKVTEDGSAILFVENNIFGTDPKTIYTLTNKELAERKSNFPIPSPNGKYITYSDERGLHLTSVDQGTTELIVTNRPAYGKGLCADETYCNYYYNPHSWSPDSNKLIIERWQYDSYHYAILDLQTKQPYTLINNYESDWSGCVSPVWSSDSNSILISGSNYGHACNVMPGLHTITLSDIKSDTIIPEPLFGTIKDEFQASIGPAVFGENGSFYFEASFSFPDEDERDGIYVTDTQTGTTEKTDLTTVPIAWLNTSEYIFRDYDSDSIIKTKAKTDAIETILELTSPFGETIYISPTKTHFAIVKIMQDYRSLGIPMQTTLEIVDLSSKSKTTIDQNVIPNSIVWGQ